MARDKVEEQVSMEETAQVDKRAKRERRSKREKREETAYMASQEEEGVEARASRRSRQSGGHVPSEQQEETSIYQEESAFMAEEGAEGGEKKKKKIVKKKTMKRSDMTEDQKKMADEQKTKREAKKKADEEAAKQAAFEKENPEAAAKQKLALRKQATAAHLEAQKEKNRADAEARGEELDPEDEIEHTVAEGAHGNLLVDGRTVDFGDDDVEIDEQTSKGGGVKKGVEGMARRIFTDDSRVDEQTEGTKRRVVDALREVMSLMSAAQGLMSDRSEMDPHCQRLSKTAEKIEAAVNADKVYVEELRHHHNRLMDLCDTSRTYSQEMMIKDMTRATKIRNKVLTIVRGKAPEFELDIEEQEQLKQVRLMLRTKFGGKKQPRPSQEKDSFGNPVKGKAQKTLKTPAKVSEQQMMMVTGMLEPHQIKTEMPQNWRRAGTGLDDDWADMEQSMRSAAAVRTTAL